MRPGARIAPETRPSPPPMNAPDPIRNAGSTCSSAPPSLHPHRVGDHSLHHRPLPGREGHRVSVFARFTTPASRAPSSRSPRSPHAWTISVAGLRRRLRAAPPGGARGAPPVPRAAHRARLPGVIPFLEQPPVVDLGISRFLAISEEVAANLVRKGVREEDLSIFRNIVDSRMFGRSRRSAIHPERRSSTATRSTRRGFRPSRRPARRSASAAAHRREAGWCIRTR